MSVISEPFRSRLDEEMLGYPPSVYEVIWMCAKHIGLEWIDKNCPLNRARPKFEPHTNVTPPAKSLVTIVVSNPDNNRDVFRAQQEGDPSKWAIGMSFDAAVCNWVQDHAGALISVKKG